MDRSFPKEENDSMSVQCKNEAAELSPRNMFLSHPLKDSALLVEHIRSHPNIKMLTHDRVEAVKKYMQDCQKPRGAKHFKQVSKTFIEKCSPAAQTMLIEQAYCQFFQYLRHQKQLDDEKLRKLSTLAEEWRNSRRQKDWRAPLQQYFEHEKNRSNKKVW